MSRMVVYWIDPTEYKANFEVIEYSPTQIAELLKLCADLRAQGMHYITSAGDNSGGGGIVKDGKLPNGEPYTWKKRRP